MTTPAERDLHREIFTDGMSNGAAVERARIRRALRTALRKLSSHVKREHLPRVIFAGEGPNSRKKFEMLVADAYASTNAPRRRTMGKP